jgi:hypothetical protein
VLIAAAALTPIFVVSSQDVSRLCLSRAVTAGRLDIGHCVGHAVDRATYGGRVYSDKAPGMAFLAVPLVEMPALPAANHWHFDRDPRIWLIRVLTSGLAFMALVLAVGRVAEGLERHTGGIAALSFGLGTLAGGLAATTFEEVTAAALCFGAFLFAWKAQPARAGLLAGLAVFFEYQSAIVVVIVAVYVGASGTRRLYAYAAGSAVGAIALALYNSAAFGSPFDLSYRYVSAKFARQQAAGFFGIAAPRLGAVDKVLLGDRGLLVASPVLVAATAGLVLLARSHRREALVCGAVTIAYLLLEFGYFLPYGGVSPGPRFFIPALPFLALGLARSFVRFRPAVAALAAASIVASTTLALSWSWGSSLGYRNTVWGELARALVGPNRRLHHDLAGNVLTYAGLSRGQSAAVVAFCAAAAFAIAVASGAQIHRRGRRAIVD